MGSSMETFIIFKQHSLFSSFSLFFSLCSHYTDEIYFFYYIQSMFALQGGL